MKSIHSNSDPSAIRNKLGEILFELAELEMDDIEPEDTFSELGLDSYFMLRFSKALESAFGLTISYKDLVSEVQDFGRLLDLLISHHNTLTVSRG